MGGVAQTERHKGRSRRVNLYKGRSRRDSAHIPSPLTLGAHARSEGYREVFLDVPFSTEEVEHTVNKMKLKKSAGPDNITAEHLKFGGQAIITWLTEILKSIVDVEQIPSCLKLGITIPVYKGGGKDPLNTNSYRGITLNSVISKVLETLLLNRMEPLFMEAGLPHPNQSAYRKCVSCADAIFCHPRSDKPMCPRRGKGVHVSL